MLNNVGKQGASVKEVSSPTKAKARVTSPEKLPKDEERYDRVSYIRVLTQCMQRHRRKQLKKLQHRIRTAIEHEPERVS